MFVLIEPNVMLALIPGMPGAAEVILIAIAGLLLFGRRLPEVARSLGKSIVEFKKGVRDIGDDVDKQSRLEDKKSESIAPPKDASTSEASDVSKGSGT